MDALDNGKGLQKNRIFTLAVNDAGRLWFGDQSSGLGYIDDGDARTTSPLPTGLIHDKVQELRLGPAGELWISTGGGLARLQAGEWLSIDVTAGLSTPTCGPSCRSGIA